MTLLSRSLFGTRRAFCAFLALVLLAADASATWSIVVINKRTREVGIASATCITNFRLRIWTPVLRVGVGAGAAQSFVDQSGANRLRIFNGLINRETPQTILDALAMQDPSHQTRQYGLVSFDGLPVTFTGTGAGAAICGVTGEVGDLVYAIQGNVITGTPVCLEAESALIETEGDLGQKLMAAMEAARRRGGDGRCSCSPGNPPGCGSPPPNFVKSAHTGYVLLARMGDPDDLNCPGGFGCALPNPGTGPDYYLALENQGGVADPDPVFVLQDMYDVWRTTKLGLADHVLSEVSKDAQRIVADGTTRTTVTVRLNDVDGVPVTSANLAVVVTQEDGDPIATVGQPVHVGGNEWELELTATTTPGRASYAVVVNDGTTPVRLWPPLYLESLSATSLRSTFWRLPAAEGGHPRFVLNLGAQNAGAPYHIYGSFSGTTPGTPIGNLMVPLNRDRLFDVTELNPAHRGLTGFVGNLDASGRAEASLLLVPGALAPLVGARLDFAAVIATPASGFVTDVAGFRVAP